jgi:hypothetical protein
VCFVGFGFEPQASHAQGKCSGTELHPLVHPKAIDLDLDEGFYKEDWTQFFFNVIDTAKKCLKNYKIMWQ